MASATDIARLRRDTGTDETSLPDEDAEDIFDEAGEKYSDSATASSFTRVLVIQSLLSSAAKMHTYKQNESTENLSDVFKHLRDLLAIWEAKTEDAITAAAGSSGAARFGGLRRKPAKVREYPGWI
jgi:hypothetical protein